MDKQRIDLAPPTPLKRRRLTVKQAADETGRTEDALRARIRRAVARLGRTLGPDEGVPLGAGYCAYKLGARNWLILATIF
jgi:hypothetical protein